MKTIQNATVIALLFIFSPTVAQHEMPRQPQKQQGLRHHRQLYEVPEYKQESNRESFPKVKKTSQPRLKKGSKVNTVTKNAQGFYKKVARVAKTVGRGVNMIAKGSPKSSVKIVPQTKKQARGNVIAKTQGNQQLNVAKNQVPVTPIAKSGGSVAIQQKRNLAEVWEEPKVSVDFVVAGFPKCATTSLLETFVNHTETDMFHREECSLASPGQADAVVFKKLDEVLATMNRNPGMKRSFKCPTSMYTYKSLSRLEKHSPNAKLVVGMRHPIRMIESFYNHRVAEMHEHGLVGYEEIPTLEQVMDEPWKGVSSEGTRFEIFLMQMGKTKMSATEMNEMIGKHHELAVRPNNFQIMLYTVEQLQDSNESRKTELRRVMQEFLGLSKPIPPFEHVNKARLGFPESIDICHSKYDSLRRQLLQQAKNTAKWLRDHFIQSPDVVLANPDHFVGILETWGADPCSLDSAMG